MPTGGPVAVTGATGFIGLHLCQRLLALGFGVRALVRDPTRATELAAYGAELIEGDLDNIDALAHLTAGCQAVVHAAGAVRGNSQADFDRVNVAGTAAIINMLTQHETSPRLLLVSSITAGQPQLSWYGQSKLSAEKLLQEQPELDWVILRPPAVYGPGDKEMLPIFQTMYRGLATVPGSPEARTSLIYVADLVEAIIACLASETARHQTLSLHDGREGGYSWHEMAAIAGAHWSRRVRLWQVPRWLLDLVAAANSWLAGITGRAPMLTPPKLRELRHPDWVMDNRAISDATGWQPRVQLKQGLELLNIPAL
ncbi:MAG: NAD(P)H-binding protein [Halioglobus sp.]|nr:NAD(P)H-binding protein [Halioglobus sp.]